MEAGGGMRWRWWLDPPASGAHNMAVDHALAEVAEATGVAALRFYEWEGPTLSFGRNEPARDVYDAEEAARRRIALVRRPTGGRAVLHDRELTYAVAVPSTGSYGARALYRTINRGLVAGLRMLGARVHVHEGGGRSPGPSEGPCFADPVNDEITHRGRKLVGSAQARIGKAILQHGSLILDGGQAAVAELRGDVSNGRSATLAETGVYMPSLVGLARALQGGIAAVMGGEWKECELSPGEKEAAARWELRYVSGDWTWRR